MMPGNSSVNGTVSCPTESIDQFRNQVYSTVYSIITVFGLVGNGFALIVLIRTFRHRLPFHIYMLNLAVADVLCISTLPLRVYYYVNKGHWTLGDFLCRVGSYALYVNLYCSVFFMTAMSCTRFIAIVFPIQNLKLVNERKTRIVCICIWVFICSTSSPFLLTGQHVDKKTNKTKCFEPPKGNTGLSKLKVLNYFSLVVGFIVPFLIILVCYAGIIRALLTGSNSKKTERQKTNHTKAIRMIVIVMLVFLVSFMPYHIQRTIHLHLLSRGDVSCEEQAYMQKSVVITLCLAAANSCFDPLLYFFSGENFRNRMSTLRKASVSSNIRQKQGAVPQNVKEQDKLQGCNGPQESQITTGLCTAPHE